MGSRDGDEVSVTWGSMYQGPDSARCQGNTLVEVQALPPGTGQAEPNVYVGRILRDYISGGTGPPSQYRISDLDLRGPHTREDQYPIAVKQTNQELD